MEDGWVIWNVPLATSSNGASAASHHLGRVASRESRVLTYLQGNWHLHALAGSAFIGLRKHNCFVPNGDSKQPHTGVFSCKIRDSVAGNYVPSKYIALFYCYGF